MASTGDDRVRALIANQSLGAGMAGDFLGRVSYEDYALRVGREFKGRLSASEIVDVEVAGCRCGTRMVNNAAGREALAEGR